MEAKQKAAEVLREFVVNHSSGTPQTDRVLQLLDDAIHTGGPGSDLGNPLVDISIRNLWPRAVIIDKSNDVV